MTNKELTPKEKVKTLIKEIKELTSIPMVKISERYFSGKYVLSNCISPLIVTSEERLIEIVKKLEEVKGFYENAFNK